MSTEKKQTEQPSEKHDDYEEISSSRNNYSTGGYRYKGNHIAEDGQGKGKKALLISLVALIVVAAVGAVGFVMFNGIKTEPPEPTAKITEPVPTDFTFAPNSVIDGLDISGKTMEQAKKLLEQNADRFITPVSFEIDVNGKTTSLDQSDFSYNYNIDEVLQKMRSGITKTTDPTNGTETPLTVTATVTEDSIKSNVDKICEERNSEPQNAKVSVFHPYAKKRFEFAEAEDGVTVNAEDLVEQITDSFAKGNAMSKITAEVEKKKADMSASQLESSSLPTKPIPTTQRTAPPICAYHWKPATVPSSSRAERGRLTRARETPIWNPTDTDPRVLSPRVSLLKESAAVSASPVLPSIMPHCAQI